MGLQQAMQKFPIRRWLHDRVGARTDTDKCRITCPHCGGYKTLGINLTNGLCQCFRCSEGGYGGDTWKGTGNLLHLVALVERISRRQAISRIYELSGTKERSFKAKAAPKADMPESLYKLEELAEDHPARVQLASRGLQHLECRLSISNAGRYSDRWIIPCMCNGKLLGFEAKSYYPAVKPKALYPTWFKTADAVYTTWEWDTTMSQAVVTESIFDAETIGCNAVGIFGSVLRDGQVAALLKLDVTVLVWFLDQDAVQKQFKSIMHKTKGLFRNYVVRVPQGQDPNSLGREKCWELIGQAVEIQDALDYAKFFGMG